MVRTTERSPHLQLLPSSVASGQVINFEIVESTHEQQTLYQYLMNLGAETKVLEICDDKDVTIAVIEGQGKLTLNQEIIFLEPGRLIFIPAQMPHTLQTQTSLVFLLSRCESNCDLPEKAWSITL